MTRQLRPDELTARYGTPQCVEFRRKIFRRHPTFAGPLARRYVRTAEASGYVEANRELRAVEQALKLGKTGLYADASDGDIVSYCDHKAHALERDWRGFEALGPDAVEGFLRAEVERAGLDYPMPSDAELARMTPDEVQRARVAAMARACCPRWWRRQLRVLAARRVEGVARDMGLVCRRRAAYVSDWTMARRASQRNRNRQLLLALDAVNQDGDVVNLGEAADASVSNPINRRNELMVRMRGFEEVAASMGYQGLFLTLTCPSKFHATHSSGEPNARYAGLSPRDGAEYLAGVWSRIRAAWQRREIGVFGFRIAEPHHDGTPHWHLLLFIQPEQAGEAVAVFRDRALAEDGNEPGAARHRCEVVELEDGKSATGYVAKYVAKNIDGFGVGDDDEADLHAVEGARRVDAWASTWGIRQFQQIGSVSVTVWRELRRLREAVEGVELEQLERIRAAADSGDWAQFVELMGGALAPRGERPLRALHVLSGRENAYGEQFERLRGILMRGVVSVITRMHEWSVVWSRHSEALAAERGGFSRAPPAPALDLCQ